MRTFNCSFYFVEKKGFDRMRKIKGIVVLVAMLFLAGITFVYAGVNDSTLVKHRYENIYSVYDEGDRVRLFYAQRYTLNGVTAYCIERGVSIDTDIYSSTTDWNVTGLNNDIKRYIRLLAYYGYDYDGHNTMEYYLATQELIWEKISGKTTYWVKGASVDSPRLDISKEKQIIEDLVSKHTTVPSFDSEVVEINIGETTTLNDSNNVLSQYEIYNSNLDGVKIENNSLKITASNLRGEEEIQLIRKNYMTKVTLIYHSGDNQKLISAGVLDPVIATVKVKSLAGSIELSKKDSQTGLTPQGDGVLDGAKYGIYNSNNELVDTIITGEKNKTKDIPYGKYTIKEIEASKGYELDANTYNVTIDSNNKDIVLDVYENIIKRKVNFFKVYATDKTSILVGEPNVQFDIYLKSTNELYKSIITDKDGYAQVELVYGTYIVKQVTSTENYEKVNDFEIVINTSDEEPINELISNAEIKAKLKVIKIDEETGKVVNRSNIKFKIKDVKSNEYVCQRIFYPKVIDVCEYSTNELGEFITPYPLLSGKYKLEEIDQVIDDYLWNKESVVRMTLQGVEVVAKITGSGAKELTIMLCTILNGKHKIKGKTTLTNMLKSGKELKVFSVKQGDLKKFTEEAKRYGILFSVLVEKKNKNPDGIVDIMVRAEDASKINRIVDRFNLATIDQAKLKSEIEKEKIEKVIKESEEKGIEVQDVDDLIADIYNEPHKKVSLENPTMAMAEKSPLSAMSLT